MIPTYHEGKLGERFEKPDEQRCGMNYAVPHVHATSKNDWMGDVGLDMRSLYVDGVTVST